MSFPRNRELPGLVARQRTEIATLREALEGATGVLDWASSMIVGDGTCGECGYEYAWVNGHMEDCDADGYLEAIHAVFKALDPTLKDYCSCGTDPELDWDSHPPHCSRRREAKGLPPKRQAPAGPTHWVPTTTECYCAIGVNHDGLRGDQFKDLTAARGGGG